MSVFDIYPIRSFDIDTTRRIERTYIWITHSKCKIRCSMPNRSVSNNSRSVISRFHVIMICHSYCSFYCTSSRYRPLDFTPLARTTYTILCFLYCRVIFFPIWNHSRNCSELICHVVNDLFIGES